MSYVYQEPGTRHTKLILIAKQWEFAHHIIYL